MTGSNKKFKFGAGDYFILTSTGELGRIVHTLPFFTSSISYRVKLNGDNRVDIRFEDEMTKLSESELLIKLVDMEL